MSSDRIRVETFDDIVVTELTRKEMESVARSLNTGASTVLAVEDWLVEENELDAIDGERRIYVGSVDRESDKAWLFVTGETDDWIPKSQSVLFESTIDDEIETPQRGLGEFAGESLQVE